MWRSSAWGQRENCCIPFCWAAWLFMAGEVHAQGERRLGRPDAVSMQAMWPHEKKARSRCHTVQLPSSRVCTAGGCCPERQQEPCPRTGPTLSGPGLSCGDAARRPRGCWPPSGRPPARSRGRPLARPLHAAGPSAAPAWPQSAAELPPQAPTAAEGGGARDGQAQGKRALECNRAMCWQMNLAGAPTPGRKQHAGWNALPTG